MTLERGKGGWMKSSFFFFCNFFGSICTLGRWRGQQCDGCVNSGHGSHTHTHTHTTHTLTSIPSSSFPISFTETLWFDIPLSFILDSLQKTGKQPGEEEEDFYPRPWLWVRPHLVLVDHHKYATDTSRMDASSHQLQYRYLLLLLWQQRL